MRLPAVITPEGRIQNLRRIVETDVSEELFDMAMSELDALECFLIARSEVEAMINERLKALASPEKLAHTGQRLRFSIDANLDFDGIIDGLERYGYRVIKVRDNAGLLM